jgi:hypothetical protein
MNPKSAVTRRFALPAVGAGASSSPPVKFFVPVRKIVPPGSRVGRSIGVVRHNSLLADFLSNAHQKDFLHKSWAIRINGWVCDAFMINGQAFRKNRTF